MHSRSDLNMDRGYELWLAAEARRRNPDIVLTSLAWCEPGWVKPGVLSPAGVEYHIKWLAGARAKGLEMEFVGLWNEHPFTVDYVKLLRKRLDETGFANTSIIAADQQKTKGCSTSCGWDIWPAMAADRELYDAVGAFGIHHAHERNSQTPAGAIASGKPVWASEETAMSRFKYGGEQPLPNLPSSAEWARTLSLNVINRSYTASVLCPLMNAWTPHFGYARHGLAFAQQPWTGRFDALPGMYVTAHHTFFTGRGWRLVNGGAAHIQSATHGLGSADLEDLTGSFVTYAAPPESTDRGNFSVVIETVGDTYVLEYTRPAAHNVTVVLAGSSVRRLRVWRSDLNVHGDQSPADIIASSSMRSLPDLILSEDGKATLLLEGGCMFTLTTLDRTWQGANANSLSRSAQPSPSSLFPLPYTSDFASQELHQPGRYFSDNCGTFEVVSAGTTRSRFVGGRRVLRQMLDQGPAQNSIYNSSDPSPSTYIGGDFLSYEVNVSVRLITTSNVGRKPRNVTVGPAAPTNSVRLCGRVGLSERDMVIPYTEPGLCLALQPANSTTAHWFLIHYQPNLSVSGPPGPHIKAGEPTVLISGLTGFDRLGWNVLSLRLDVFDVTATVNGVAVATIDLERRAAQVGMAGGCVALGTGWNLVDFDRLKISPLPTHQAPHRALARQGEAWLPRTPSLRSMVQGFFATAMRPQNSLQSLPVGHSTEEHKTLWIGARVRVVGGAAIVLEGIGRFCSPYNHRAHPVRVLDESGVDIIPTGSLVTMDPAKSDALGFVYAQLPTPVVLKAGARYTILSGEETGGDLWYNPQSSSTAINVDFHSSMTFDEDIEVLGPGAMVTSSDGRDAPLALREPSSDQRGSMYGPLNLLFHRDGRTPRAIKSDDSAGFRGVYLVNLSVNFATFVFQPLLFQPLTAASLDNGLGMTPPMTLSNYEMEWGGETITPYPTETTVMRMARALVSTGLHDLGYDIVHVDCGYAVAGDPNTDVLPTDPSCWHCPMPSHCNESLPCKPLEINATRFPHGMKALVSHLHAMKLKFSTYSSGHMCCNKNLRLGMEAADAAQFVSWGTNAVFYDDCYTSTASFHAMTAALNRSSHKVYVSIHSPWTSRMTRRGFDPTWPQPSDSAAIANDWRTGNDIQLPDDGSSFGRIMNRARNNNLYAQFAGPGNWNWPDILEVGNPGISDAEGRSQFSLWCLMKSPLRIGTDITRATAATMNTLSNKEAISINKDKLGVQGTLRRATGEWELWAGPLSGGCVAGLLVNLGNGTSMDGLSVSATWDELGISAGQRMEVHDIWLGGAVIAQAVNSMNFTIGLHVPGGIAHNCAFSRLCPLPHGITSRSSPSKRLLGLDHDVIHSSDGAELTVGRVTKHPGSLIVRDRPWENRFLNMFPSICAWLPTICRNAFGSS
jgi:alpha-galactosidase